MRKTRTLKELQLASDHLHYEYWMLTETATRMRSRSITDVVVVNALLESFTIHARVILDFLYADKPKQDDVIAEDYFDDPDGWRAVRPNPTHLLEKLHDRVGKEVAHLTYVRQTIVTEEQKRWNFYQITHDVREVFKVFATSVSREKLGQRWLRGEESLS